MREDRTDEPLQALESLCSGQIDQVAEQLVLHRARIFYGPESTLAAAVRDATADQQDRLDHVLKTIATAATEVEGLKNSAAWNRFWQLLLLYGSSGNPASEICFDASAAIDLLAATDDGSISGTPTATEVAALRPAAAKLENFGWKKQPREWTAADWRLLGFVNDGLSAGAGMIEQTPIFIADEQHGNALWLVAERLAGPPRLITPHWWRLGLLPLGSNSQLVQAIHAGFRAVLGASPDTRYQFRWWIRPFFLDRWHDDILEARSAEVAAACLAQALMKRADDAPPLLDPKAGVSGTLEGVDGTELHKRLVGDVKYVPRKLQAAQQAGLLTFLLGEGCAHLHAQQSSPRVQPVKTFGDAYEALLTTATRLQEYKQRQSSMFIAITDDNSTTGKHIEVPTHPDFLDSKTGEEAAADAEDADLNQHRATIEARLQQAPGVEHFLLGQPIWHAEAPVRVRWDMAEREDEPTDEASQGEPAHRSPQRADAGAENGEGKWKRIGRDKILEYAVSQEAAWQRVGVVCGAGLGKTTNLKWLAANINRQHHGRGKDLAVFLDLYQLAKQLDLREYLVNQVVNLSGDDADSVRFALDRSLSDGRVTFCLDSLDQANPDPGGEAVGALCKLLLGRWSKCRVWVSARPYAFRIARPALESLEHNPPWQFLRIGQLDEPECRQLLETFRRPGST